MNEAEIAAAIDDAYHRGVGHGRQMERCRTLEEIADRLGLLHCCAESSASSKFETESTKCEMKNERQETKAGPS